MPLAYSSGSTRKLTTRQPGFVLSSNGTELNGAEEISTQIQRSMRRCSGTVNIIAEDPVNTEIYQVKQQVNLNDNHTNPSVIELSDSPLHPNALSSQQPTTCIPEALRPSNILRLHASSDEFCDEAGEYILSQQMLALLQEGTAQGCLQRRDKSIKGEEARMNVSVTRAAAAGREQESEAEEVEG